MHNFQKQYLNDIVSLKSYAGLKYKLTYFKYALKQSGFEIDEQKPRITGVNDEKLDVNISRARSKVLEYAICNPWDYFVTLTLDKRKYDRTDLGKFNRDLGHWLRNYQSKHGIAIKYLLIPELHSDGQNWHMHGFLMGLPAGHLSDFVPGVHPQKLIDAGYKNWDAYATKFGFVSVDTIRSHEGAARYVTKYVSKNLDKAVKELNAHMYYCSKGLKRATEIKRGTLCESVPFGFENDWVKIRWFNSTETLPELQ